MTTFEHTTHMNTRTQYEHTTKRFFCFSMKLIRSSGKAGKKLRQNTRCSLRLNKCRQLNVDSFSEYSLIVWFCRGTPMTFIQSINLQFIQTPHFVVLRLKLVIVFGTKSPSACNGFFFEYFSLRLPHFRVSFHV